MNNTQKTKARDAVEQAAAYLKSSGIRLPDFEITTEPPDKLIPFGRSYLRIPFGGSFVDGYECGELRLNMGYFPTAFHRHWFAMHELGHLLWELHRPLRWKNFRVEFGEPRPPNYIEVHVCESWKTALSGKLSWCYGPHRPKGQPSWYGARGGGEERFCDLIGFMYAHGDFSKPPPNDIADLWDVCWENGLTRMT